MLLQSFRRFAAALLVSATDPGITWKVGSGYGRNHSGSTTLDFFECERSKIFVTSFATAHQVLTVVFKIYDPILVLPFLYTEEQAKLEMLSKIAAAPKVRYYPAWNLRRKKSH